MEYPATVIIDKTAQEIAQAGIEIGRKYHLSPDVLCLSFEKAHMIIMQQKIASLEEIIIDAVNESKKAEEGSENGND